MFTVQRIYAYQPDSKQTAVFIDRLYPRGVHKEVFATALWLKDITPSANLRRWYQRKSRLKILTVLSAVIMKSCKVMPSRPPSSDCWIWSCNTAISCC